jgi:hypothetical protein
MSDDSSLTQSTVQLDQKQRVRAQYLLDAIAGEDIDLEEHCFLHILIADENNRMQAASASSEAEIASLKAALEVEINHVHTYANKYYKTDEQLSEANAKIVDVKEETLSGLRLFLESDFKLDAISRQTYDYVLNIIDKVRN